MTVVCKRLAQLASRPITGPTILDASADFDTTMAGGGCMQACLTFFQPLPCACLCLPPHRVATDDRPLYLMYRRQSRMAGQRGLGGRSSVLIRPQASSGSEPSGLAPSDMFELICVQRAIGGMSRWPSQICLFSLESFGGDLKFCVVACKLLRDAAAISILASSTFLFFKSVPGLGFRLVVLVQYRHLFLKPPETITHLW